MLAAVVAGYLLSVLLLIDARKGRLVQDERGWGHTLRFKIVADNAWPDFVSKLR